MNLNKKILLVTNKLEKNPTGGREMLSKLNYLTLKEIFKKNLFSHEIKKKKINKVLDAILALGGNIDGVNSYEVKKINNCIKANKISHLFINGSNLGKIANKIKSKNLKIITFCHNVESNFFLQKLKINFSFKNLYLFLVNYLCEFKAVGSSDFLILLNDRDRKLMFKFFFKKNYFIVPMSIYDQYQNNSNKKLTLKEKYVLFVGGDFYGNIQGIRWYINNVVPYINIKTLFVGKNLYRTDFKNKSKLFFSGYVKNLNSIYRNALFVIAPILSGSGMKTKVAESLMYGKMVIGLKESFAGYEKFKNKIGVECKNSKDFVKAVNTFSRKKIINFNKNLRKIYINNFSNYSMKTKYIEIFRKI
jgi:hypothetical protein